MNEIQYFVYIITNKYNTVFYIGITNDIERRIFEHKSKIFPSSFSSKYNLYKLIYFEIYNDINLAIAREKELKSWRRSKKIDLIKKQNPNYNNLIDIYFKL